MSSEKEGEGRSEPLVAIPLSNSPLCHKFNTLDLKMTLFLELKSHRENNITEICAKSSNRIAG